VAALYDARSKLKRHVDRLVGEKSHADVVDTLRQSRFVLEQDKALKLTVPTLSLYCDWAQHVQLERNEHGWTVLGRLDTLITGNSQQDIQAAAQQALQLGQLQTELGTLFTQVGASSRLVTEQGNWVGFLVVLLNDLCNRPIGTSRYLNNRMVKTVIVRRRNCSLRRSAGTCWCWRVRERRKLRSSSEARQNRAADLGHLKPRIGRYRPLMPR
jgi:hypothetical protein